MKRLRPLLLCLLLFITACSNSAAPESTNSQAALQGTTEILGKIKEINGNEILLALAEEAPAGERPSADGEPNTEQPPSGGSRPERDRGDDTAQESGEEGAQRERPQFDGETGSMPQRTEARGQNTERQGESDDQMPQRGPDGENSNRGEGGPQGDRSGQGPGGGTSITLTGEEQTYLIPVTATITSGTGDNATTIRFTQLAVKNVVRMQLDDEGTIVSVEVLQ